MEMEELGRSGSEAKWDDGVGKGCFRKTSWKFSVSDAGNTLLGKLFSIFHSRRLL